MKKLLALVISLITVVLMLTACSPKTDALENVGGKVLSGNGTYLVEKGDYLYFVNGQDSTTVDNKFGTPVKSSLVRVKKTDLAKPSEANVETVVPKVMMTGSYSTGVYFFGDYVYYATPCDNKDKAGNIQNSKTEFNRLNLKTGKEDKTIAIADDNTCQFRYVESGDKVYLFYTFKETVDETTENKFKVVDATNGKDVYTSPAYLTLAFPDDSSVTAFFVKVAFSEKLDQDESFNDLYSYKAGDSDAKLAITGAGSYALGRDDRYKEVTDAQKLTVSGIEGVTMSLIKNTGKLVVFKVTTLDGTYQSNMYYGAEIENGAIKSGTLTKLGDSNVHVDAAITASAYYESLNSIYYVDSEKYGLMKYNYANGSNPEFGTEIISTDCKSLSIIFVEGDYMYLCNTAEGIYYRANYKAENKEDIKVKQINGLAMQTPTAFYVPRVIGNYFIGSYSGDPYYKYVYVIDMTKIDAEKEEGKDKTPYEQYLEDVKVSDEETVKGVHATMLGKMTDSDKSLYETYLEDNFKD